MSAFLATFGCGGGAAAPDAGGWTDNGQGQVDAGRTPDPPTVDAGGGGAEAPVLKVMTFNIKRAELSSLEEIARVILSSGADIVALQEVDKEAPRSGETFQSYRLGQLTGMASSFRRALAIPSGGDDGLAILSRYPILSSDKLYMTSDEEQRVVVAWHVDLGGGELATIANTRFGRDANERATQAEEAVSFLEGHPRVIFLGDFNEGPDGPAVYSTILAAYDDAWEAGEGEGYTVPSEVPDRRLDYIFLALEWGAAAYAEVYETTASDHRPVIAHVPAP